MQLKKIGTNYRALSWYTIGNLCSKGISFLLLPVLLRLLSVEDYGIVTTYLTYVDICVGTCSLGLPIAIRSLFTGDKKCDDRNCQNTTIAETISFFSFGLIVFLIALKFPYRINATLVALCFIQSYFCAVTDTVLERWMMEKNYAKRSILLIIPGLMTFLLSFYLMTNFYNNGYMGRVWGGVIVSSIVGVYSIHAIYKNGWFRPSLLDIKKALGIGGPIVLYNISNLAINQMDRIMITKMRTPSDTGRYSVACSLALAPIAIIGAIQSVWQPYVSDCLRKDGLLDRINNGIKCIALFDSFICVGLLFFGEEILGIWGGQKYLSSIIYLKPLCFACLFEGLFYLFVAFEYYYKKTTIMAKVTGVAATINFILNLIFINSFGSVAAAYTTLLAKVVMLFLHMKETKRLTKDRIDLYGIAPALTLFAVGILIDFLPMYTRGKTVSYCVFFCITMVLIKKWRKG